MQKSHFCAITASFVICAMFAGCSGGGGGNTTPTTGVRISLTDTPGNFQHVYVTIGSVSVVSSDNAVTVINSTPQTFDLLALQNVDAIIGTATLAPGQYSQIRLIVTAASVVDNTGTTYNLNVPSGAQTGIKLVDNFTITNDQITSIVLDFNADQSIVRTGNVHAAGGVQYLLKPVIHVVAEIVSGQISGIVLDSTTSMPIAAVNNPLVTAYPAGSPTDGSVPATATAVVSSVDGTYTLTRLPAGSYDLYFTADGYVTQSQLSVNVTANATTTVNTVHLTPSP